MEENMSLNGIISGMSTKLVLKFNGGKLYYITKDLYGVWYMDISSELEEEKPWKY